MKKVKVGGDNPPVKNAPTKPVAPKKKK